METGTSLIQAIAALLIVLGLIALVAWAFKRFAFNGNLLRPMLPKAERQLEMVESIWLDARYRVVVVKDGETRHTLLLGPQQALQLNALQSGSGPTGLPHA